MKKIFLLIIILSLSLLISCSPATSPAFTPSEGEGEEEPSGDRVVLVELFNTDGCSASALINPIMEDLAQQYGTKQVILLEEAGWGKYSTPETMERFDWYVPGDKHTPFIAFNGLSETFSEGVVGGGGGGGYTPPPTNHAPVISNLIADPENIGLGDISVITCNATDQDGDSLNYSWTKTGGTISGSGKTITWTAPATAGTYTITCTVDDGKGKQNSASVNVEVISGSPVKIFLRDGGTLNSISINTSNPIISVSPGETISGTVNIEVQRPTSSSGNVTPVGYTPTWGTHSSSYVGITNSTPIGNINYNVSINLTAPNTSGTYYLTFASHYEMGVHWIMSQTNWTVGTPQWDDGNDIADHTEAEIGGALSNGYAFLNMWVNGEYKLSPYGITYVKIDVTGSQDTRIISLSGDTTFGDVQVGESKTQTLIISNTGNSTLQVYGINYSTSAFSGDWSGPISAGASQPVDVTFTPTEVKAYSGTLTVSSSKTDGTNTKSVSGTGTPITTTIIVTSPNGGETWNAGGTRSITWTVSGDISHIDHFILNYGTNGICNQYYIDTISSASRSYSWIIPNTPSTQCKIGVWAIDASNNSLAFDDSDGLFTISPVIDTRIIRLEGDLNFGDVQVGDSAQRTLAIYNDGNSTLNVTGINYSTPDFSGDWSGPISAGASQPVDVTFAPTELKTYSGTLTVSSNATSGTNNKLIYGTGTPPEQYTLTTSVSPSGSGYFYLSPSGGTYAAGTTVLVQALAFVGYSFDHWGGDFAGISSSWTNVTMNSNKNVTAYFAGGTIQAMIDAASDGDTITLEAKTYYESGITFPSDRRIILQGADLNNPSITVIDGEMDTIIFRLENVPSGTTIKGLTIQNGRQSIYGGGITILNGSPIIKGNIIRYNEIWGDYYGGGIYVEYREGVGSTLIEDNEIYNNKSGTGGGIRATIREGGDAEITIRNNHIYDNQAIDGGGIYANIRNGGTGEINIKDNEINNNTSESYGGGIFSSIFTNQEAYILIDNNLIHDNSTTNRGGGIYCYFDPSSLGSINVINNSIQNNIITIYYLWGSGINIEDFGSPAGVIIGGSGLENTICGNTGGPNQIYDAIPPLDDYPDNYIAAACGGSIIIRLEGYLDFGYVQAGNSSQEILTICNDGYSTLTVYGIDYPTSFSGDWSGDIPAGSHHDVTVTFSPTLAINYSGYLTVNSNKNSGTNTKWLEGQGTHSTRIISLSGDMAFGSVNVSGDTATRTLTISNTGNSSLNITGISYPYSVFSGNFVGSIAAGSSQLVDVTFDPSAVQTYSGTLTVNSNKTGGTNTRSISGTGISDPDTRIISLSGDMAFGSVNVSGDTATRTLTISNTGNSSLNVTGISYPYSVFSGNFVGSIAAGSSQLVDVTFDPSAVQTYSGTLTVNSNKTGGTNTRSISGTGVQDDTCIINLSGDLDFGNVDVGDSDTRTLRISNTGNSTLYVTGIDYPYGDSVYSGDWSGPIPAGSYHDVTVTFAPIAGQYYNGQLWVNSNKTSGTDNKPIYGRGIINEPVYRAVCIGISDYPGTEDDIAGPVYDVDRMRDMLSHCRFGPSNITFSTIQYLKDDEATLERVTNGISSLFSGADSTDISYIYFSGHGAPTFSYDSAIKLYNGYMTVDTFELLLRPINGTKVVILDCCFSGGFLGKEKRAINEDDLIDFNANVIDVFSQNGLRDNLSKSDYQVLTSSQWFESSHSENPWFGDPYGLFTQALVQGCGYDYYTYPYWADNNGDRDISLQEACTYTEYWINNNFPNEIQYAQMYPEGSDFPIVEY